jgi:hypothetical protein
MDDVTELKQAIIDNWWKMRQMSISIGVLVEDKLVAEGLMTDDQRAVRPRRIRRQGKRETQDHERTNGTG